MKTINLIIILSLAIFPLCISNAYAQTNSAIGTVLIVEGSASVERFGAAAKPLKQDQPIFWDDLIKTNESSRLLISFIDDTQFILGEKASMTIDDYAFNAEEPKDNKGRFSVLRGAFFYASGLLSKDNDPNVKIRTAYGSVGIRGTKLWCGNLDKHSFGVYVEEGLVNFTTDEGTSEVAQGQGITVKSIEYAPEQANAWTEEKINEAYAKTELKSSYLINERMIFHKDRHERLRKSHIKALKNRNNDNIDTDKNKILPEWE